MKKWEEVPLGDCISTMKGAAFKSSMYSEEGQPIVRVSNFTDNSISLDDIVYYSNQNAEMYSKYKLRTWDVLIQTVGSWQHNPESIVGKVVKVPKELDGALLNQNIVKVIPNEGFDNKFLYYRLKDESFKFYNLGCAQGAANQASITLDSIKKFKFNLPPLPTQRKIASILSAYDDLLENNLKRIKLLEEIAQRTYEEWFVKFRINGKQLKLNKETGLPDGWEEKEFQFFGEIITGKTPSTLKEEFFNGNVPFVKTPDMSGFPYVLDTTQKLSELGASTQKKKFIPKNSLMVSCIGSAGVYALASKDCQTNQQINSISFYEEFYSYYFYCFAKILKPILEGLGSNGATMTNVNKGKFEKMTSIYPTKKLIIDFHELVRGNFESILNLQKQNRLLKESRDILLPRLMSGVIEVG